MDWLVTVGEGAALWFSLEVGRATVVLLAAATAAFGMRRASAATRHLMWCAALLSLLALPAVSAAMPWRWFPLAESATAAEAVAANPDEGVVVGPDVASHTSRGSRSAAGPVETRNPTVVDRALAFTTSNALPLVLGIWALGVAFSLGRLAIGGIVLRAAVHRAQRLDDPAWRTPLYEAADRLDLPSAPRLVMSDRMPMPFVTGVVRPTIVLPAAATGWSPGRRRAVLLHELAHVRRRDLLLNTIAHVVCALWWFHPLARIAARRLRAESERACDDLVLRLGTLPSAYADHLLQIVRDGGRVSAPAVALPMAQRREFEGRMLAILEADARRDPPRRRHALLAGLAFALLVVPLAGLGPAPVEARVPTTPPVPQAIADREDRDVAGVHEPEPVAETETDVVADVDLDEVRSELRSAKPSPAGQDTGVVAALRAALRDPSGEVRAEAAWALGSMDATSAGADLVSMLRTDVSPEARRMAVWALVQIDHAAGADGIASIARSDDNADVREMAVWALGQFEDPAALPTIIAALGDEDVDVRSIAAWAVGTLEPADAPAALISALEDADGEVREHAAWALGQIGDEDAVPALTRVIGDDVAGEAALWAIGHIGGEAARPALMEALRNGNDEVRAAAARALAGRGGGSWPWPWPRPMPRY